MVVDTSALVCILLAEPEAHHTRIKGNKLWHLALLEFWLQQNLDAVGYPLRFLARESVLSDPLSLDPAYPNCFLCGSIS